MSAFAPRARGSIRQLAARLTVPGVRVGVRCRWSRSGAARRRVLSRKLDVGPHDGVVGGVAGFRVVKDFDARRGNPQRASQDVIQATRMQRELWRPSELGGPRIPERDFADRPRRRCGALEAIVEMRGRSQRRNASREVHRLSRASPKDGRYPAAGSEASDRTRELPVLAGHYRYVTV